MKKIGLLTLPLNSNIGGTLQAYALMEVIRNMGHMPVLFNRRKPSKRSKSIKYSPFKDFCLMLFRKLALYQTFKGSVKNLPNVKFIDTYISNYTNEFNWSEQLSRHVKEHQFHAIVVGSDQVWRPCYAKTILSDFFLNFIPKESKIKRISYAASFGVQDWEFTEKQTQEFSKLLQRFDAVSVREDSGKELCLRHFDVKAEHVLDPTLLLTSEHYINKFSLKTHLSSKRRLLTYILDKSDDKIKLTNAIAEKLSLQTFAPSDFEFSSNNVMPDSEDRKVENWLTSFYHADFVITDSFHGTVFSILFNKEFIVYGNPKRGIARFTSLLKALGLDNQLVLESAQINMNEILKPINWKIVNRKIQELRIKSIEFLKSSI